MNLREEKEKVGHESKTVKRQNDTSKEEKVRKPTIIYVETPRIIHADASHFMSLVQELTGKNSNCDSTLNTSSSTISTSSSTVSTSANENSQKKRNEYSVFSHRSLVSSDDHLVADKANQTDGFYQSLVVDAVDLYLSPPY